MKEKRYVEIICKGFCKFYKEGKEDFRCGAYTFLVERFPPEELEAAIQTIKAYPDYSCDEDIRKMVCEKCEFLVNGCDFRDGLSSPPCGGYMVVEGLIKKGSRIQGFEGSREDSVSKTLTDTNN